MLSSLAQGSRETCENLYTENLLEWFLRSRPEAIQLRKLKGICFNKVAPCRRPRTNYCDLDPPRHTNGYVESDPAFFELFDMDYFLTGSASNGNFDGQLAVRLARFFRDDVDRAARRCGQRIFRQPGRPARPARVLDMGCGRGSYVELFERWGLVAIGVDGDVVVRRTLPKSSLVWDLTEPLDLPGIRASEAEGFRSLIPAGLSGDGVDGTMDLFLTQIEAIESEADQAGACSFEAPDDPTEEEDATLILSVGLKMQGTGGHHSVALLRHICCSDVRCVGYGMGVSDPPIGSVWRLASSQGEDPYNGTRPSFFYGLRYLRRKSWPTARASPTSPTSDGFTARKLLPDSFLQSLGLLTVSFGSADWVLSLEVGQFIPRSKEEPFLMNLVRHAELGIVILWGSAGPNPRSAEEVQQLFKPLGFAEDRGAARELRLFAGLAFGGQKEQLLVLRRRMGTWASLDPWNRQDVHNMQGSGEPAVLVGHHAYLVQYRGKQAVHCAVHETYGLVRPGLLWVDGGCGGIFRVWRTNNVNELPGTFCINADHRYKECIIPSWLTDPKINAIAVSAATTPHRRQNLEDSQSSPKKVSELAKPAQLDWQMHASADQLVPRLAVWRGDPRLNMIFYKFARKLASAPCQDNRIAAVHLKQFELHLEWRWLWSTDWRPLLRLSAQMRGRRVEPEVSSRFARLFLILRSIGSRLSRKKGLPVKSRVSWKLSSQALGLFRQAEVTAERALDQQLTLARGLTSEKLNVKGRRKVSWSAADCLPRWRFRRDRKKLKGPPPPEAVLRRFALAQRSAASLLARIPPVQALQSQALLDLLLIAHRAALAVMRWGEALPCAGHLPKRSQSHHPVAKPAGCMRPWAKDSVEAWYIYRLVACDPSA